MLFLVWARLTDAGIEYTSTLTSAISEPIGGLLGNQSTRLVCWQIVKVAANTRLDGQNLTSGTRCATF
jgi:hypothetical protein